MLWHCCRGEAGGCMGAMSLAHVRTRHGASSSTRHSYQPVNGKTFPFNNRGPRLIESCTFHYKYLYIGTCEVAGTLQPPKCPRKLHNTGWVRKLITVKTIAARANNTHHGRIPLRNPKQKYPNGLPKRLQLLPHDWINSWGRSTYHPELVLAVHGCIT